METNSTPQPKLFPGLDVLGRLVSVAWWRYVISFSWQFKKFLYLPAIIFFVAGVVFVVLGTMMASFRNMGSEPQDAGPLLLRLGMLTCGLASGGIILIVSMAVGVIRLAAFTRAYLLTSIPTPAELSSDDFKSTMRETQKNAFAQIGKSKGYIAKSWLLATLIVVPVIGVFCGATFVTGLATAPDDAQYPLITAMKSFAVPALATLAVTFVILSNYSMIILALSSMINMTIGQLVRRSLILLFTTAPMLTAVTVIVLILNTVIGTPYAVPELLHMRFSDGPDNLPLPLALICEAWQVISGIMLVPISTALLAEVLRDCISTDQNQVNVARESEPNVSESVTAESANTDSSAAETDN